MADTSKVSLIEGG